MRNVRPLRIGYALKRFPRLSETFILNEILELERQGVVVEVFSLLTPPEERRHDLLDKIKARVTYLPGSSLTQGWRVREGLTDPRPQALEELVDLDEPLFSGKTAAEACKLHLQAATVAMLARSRGVEHLHAHFGSDPTTVALLAGRMAGLPYSFTAHARDIYHTYVDPASDDAMRRAKLREAAFTVTVSEYNKRHLEGLAGGSAQIHRLYNGVDIGRFQPTCPLGRDPRLILSVGRFVEKKGFPHLIEACALLRDRGCEFRCVLVGDGPDAASLKQQVSDLGLAGRIDFTGSLEQERLVELMSTAHVMALPCVVSDSGDRDGLPTVLLEALAAGLPAVTTTVSGGPEIVENGWNGYLVPPGEAAPLAEALHRILDDEQGAREMGAAGRKKAEALFDLRGNVSILRQYFHASARGENARAGEAA